MESGVPDRQHLVSKPDSIPHDSLVRLIKEIRLSAFCIDVCVGTEERHESTGLIPSDEHFDARVAEESADVG